MTIQGDVGLVDTVIKNNITLNSITTINLLRFRNPAAYVITVSRYSKKYNRTDVLYEYTLSAGDTVLDASGYSLEYGDILYAKSDVLGTTYTVNVV
jgi:hypothetical protein